VKRREFITLLGGAAVFWPLAARAQQPDRMRRIGVLEGQADGPLTRARHAVFQETLERLGWTQDGNVRIDYRFAGGSVQLAQAFAKELIVLRPDVTFATSTLAASALRRESRVIPIVFLGVSDPIGEGFIASLARPGANMTGILNFEARIAGKWLAMLKEIEPRLARAAFLANPKTTPYDYFLQAAKEAASSLTIELVPTPIADAVDIERVIVSFARAPNGGLVLPPDITTLVHRDLVIALAARHRLPATYPFRYVVAAGGLMSYGPDLSAVFRQASSYVDRILRGDKPAEFPVQAPVKYETVLNLKTATALGLTVPDTLLVAADEVIE
jgi:putative ABC transport system substrate-binding protein